MGERTGIEWCDATWNPIRGCSRVSEGCRHCYAERVAARFNGPGQPYEGLARRYGGEPRWTNEVRFVESQLDLPLRWRKPRRIFVNSTSDLFHDKVEDAWIDRIFAVMALAPQHVFIVLTKRPERMREYLSDQDLNDRISSALGNMLDGPWVWNEGKRFRPAIERMISAFLGVAHDDEGNESLVDDPMPLPNVWLGVSVEDQATADERIPLLLDTPAAKRLISAEPLLGPVDLSSIDIDGDSMVTPLHSASAEELSEAWGEKIDQGQPRLDWVIVGGESGPDARPMHPSWARSLRDQCVAAGVAFHFKQWGEWGPDSGPPGRGRDRIFDGEARCAVWTGSGWTYHRSGYEPAVDAGQGEWVYRLGKKAAGRTLDGREWNESPTQRRS